MAHHWQYRDDLLIIYIMRRLNRRKEAARCPKSVSREVSDIMGISPQSMELRYRNLMFLASDGRKGAPKYSTKTKLVWHRHRQTPLDEIERTLADEYSVYDMTRIKDILASA